MAIDGAIQPPELCMTFEDRAEAPGDPDGTIVAEGDQANGGIPAERAVCVVAHPKSRFGRVSAALLAVHQTPADLAPRKACGTPEPAPADEIAGGLLLQRPIAETAQMPVP